MVRLHSDAPKIDILRQWNVDFTYYLFTLHYSLKITFVDFEVISNSEYWIELIIESGYYDDKTILKKCVELKKILISTINPQRKTIIKCHPNHSALPKRNDNFTHKIVVSG